MIHLGDITKINGAEIPIVDVITGGSPCQDLSVAGKRAGLAGERSGLFMEQIRIVKEMREHDRRAGRTDEYIRPRYMVWENVPGAFSSGNPKGADFAAVIEEIIKVAEPRASVSVCIPNGGWTKSGCFYADDGSWSIAWRVHDAQFWGVPQRRKRIALVADFGGLSAPEILFERKGLSRDPEQSRTARQETAEGTGNGVEGANCYGLDHVMLSGGTTYQGRGYYDNVSGCLKTHPHGVCETISFQERAGKPGGGKGILIQNERTGALSTLNNQSVLQTREPILLESNQNHATQDPIVGDDISPCISQGSANGTATVAVLHVVGCDVYNQEVTGEVAASLTAASGGTNTSGPKVLAAGFSFGQSAKAGGIGAQEECSPTLSAVASGTNQVPAVYDARGNGNGEIAPTMTGDHQNRVTDYTAIVNTYQDVTGTLNPGAHPGSYNGQDAYNDMLITSVYGVSSFGAYKEGTTGGRAQGGDNGGGSENIAVQNAIVRRLTPLECERLQGYPDGWTDIGEWVDSKGKKHKDADSPRYKALGNSIALPFWEWLARRIAAQYERRITLGSLFDGISGFCLVFARAGCKPVFSSEIEEYPIAVAKKHFGDDDLGLEGDYERYL